MGATTGIEWTERTWNPVVGCSIVSSGCTNCYAMRMAARLEKMLKPERRGGALLPNHYSALTKPSKAGSVWTGRVNIAPERTLTEPLRRRKPTTYFVNSMGDLFHESVPDEWIDRVFAVMALCPQHIFQVLTKRADRMRDYLTEMGEHYAGRRDGYMDRWTSPAGEFSGSPCAASAVEDSGWPLPNVHIGVSTENQAAVDVRVPELLATPAAVRFVSAEPLLGPVDFTRINCIVGGDRGLKNALSGDFWISGCGSISSQTLRRGARLNQVIVGSESGPRARPCDLSWVRSLRDQCVVASVAFFWKQHVEAGRKISLPELDGRTWAEFPHLDHQ